LFITQTSTFVPSLSSSSSSTSTLLPSPFTFMSSNHHQKKSFSLFHDPQQPKEKTDKESIKVLIVILFMKSRTIIFKQIIKPPHPCKISVSQIERVFTAANQKKCWDHFSRAQRKNIDNWKQLMVCNFGLLVHVCCCFLLLASPFLLS